LTNLLTNPRQGKRNHFTPPQTGIPNASQQVTNRIVHHAFVSSFFDQTSDRGSSNPSIGASSFSMKENSRSLRDTEGIASRSASAEREAIPLKIVSLKICPARSSLAALFIGTEGVGDSEGEAS
jgi:hypothetical protein